MASNEQMIALSDAGIPFRDPDFNCSSEDILKRRENEGKTYKGTSKFSSTVKTPTYLNKGTGRRQVEEESIKKPEKDGFQRFKRSRSKIYCMSPVCRLYMWKGLWGF